ncbi:patatin-like phospholipase family protein [Winogradskyella vidalii]|uniref:patatin-like phospholipase family protein n=1 Tax=Winogradskyella vidalii TaxID=2615024 RepID=UPI0015CD954E|nr:patatin-like phospholipase family protein [Winogradskyella vidalii]
MLKISVRPSYLKLFLVALLLLGFQSTIAQNKKPKVALVLSGGGAKGVAHIPTLQALDSLGIVPDLVVGNSMGSIVGGLYAMGYSGDSIASIALNAKWDELIGGNVSLKSVSVEEKSEYNKYLISLDWKDGKIDTGSYLLNDQNIREFITTLTYSTYAINNFDDLAIPFRAIATDIVNGKEVILDKGSLSFAMRASMSIPGAFSAVPYGNTLLVDGGLLNNFPVDVAKKWGADIIIGSDVGSGMVTKEKLNNISALLFQAGMMGSNSKTPENRKLCNILIDHSEHLTFTTGDFSRISPIYDEGKIALKDNIAALTVLADSLKPYQQRAHQLPETKDEFVLDTIIYNGISKANLSLVKARTNIKTNQTYTREEIVEGINRAMGTTLFSQMTYTPSIKGDTLGLELQGFEKSNHQVRGSLHYDGNNGAGIIFNYTGRNILGSASRTLVTIDVAEQPKFRLQYQRNFSHDRNWWWRSEAFAQQLKQKVFIGGENVDNMKYRFFEFDNQFNRNLSAFKSYVGIGVKYVNTNLRPTIDPEFNENVFSLEKYNFNAFKFYIQYVYNTLNHVFYPTEGTFIQADIRRSLHNSIAIQFSDDNIADVDGSTNNFTKLGFNYERRLRLKPKTVGIIGFNSSFIIEDNFRDNTVELSEYGVGANYFLGGNITNPRKDSYVFPGLNENEVNASQFMRLNLGLQMQAFHKLYVTPHVDIASVGFGNIESYLEEVLSSQGHWSDSNEASILASAGATVSYSSILGPVDFDISWVNNTNKVRFFIGIGIHFNRSN